MSDFSGTVGLPALHPDFSRSVDIESFPVATLAYRTQEF